MAFPTEGVQLTLPLLVQDLVRSRAFYEGVLGATVYLEYGGTSCVDGAEERPHQGHRAISS